MKDAHWLHEMYNATSTDDGTGRDEIETYENWLERQLLSRIKKLETIEKATAATQPPQPKQPKASACPFKFKNMSMRSNDWGDAWYITSNGSPVIGSVEKELIEYIYEVLKNESI